MKANWLFMFIFLFRLTEQTILPNKISALPGLSLTTHLALDALATVYIQMCGVVQTTHYCIWETVWPTTVQVKLQQLDHVHTVHTSVNYILLPSNVPIINMSMCGPLNREGTLCGKCKDRHGIAYNLECSKCWEHGLWMDLVLFPGTVPNYCAVLSSGDLPHQNNLLSTEGTHLKTSTFGAYFKHNSNLPLLPHPFKP